MSGEYLNVLLVEDDQSNIDLWSDAVETHNIDSDNKGFSIKWDSAQSLFEAREKIALSAFDAVIVDLRLKKEEGSASHNDDGNDLVRELIATKPIGIVVYSGQQADSYECTQVVVIDRAAGLQPVFEWLDKNKTMFFSFRRAKSVLETKTAQLFYNSIWPRWSNWIQNSEQSESFVPVAITRHITSHVYATLLADGPHGVHPEEWYFVPPLQDKLGTGDLIRQNDGVVEVVITPRCDLVRDDKNETIQLAKCVDASSTWAELCQKVTDAKNDLSGASQENEEKLNKKLKGAEEELRKYTQHKSNSSVLHFLPRMRMIDNSEIGPFFVRFDTIRSILRTSEEVKEIQPMRIASVTSEFLPSLVERLGSYFSRIGTPDYSHPD